jgi:hypothetical protein
VQVAITCLDNRHSDQFGRDLRSTHRIQARLAEKPICSRAREAEFADYFRYAGFVRVAEALKVFTEVGWAPLESGFSVALV